MIPYKYLTHGNKTTKHKEEYIHNLLCCLLLRSKVMSILKKNKSIPPLHPTPPTPGKFLSLFHHLDLFLRSQDQLQDDCNDTQNPVSISLRGPKRVQGPQRKAKNLWSRHFQIHGNSAGNILNKIIPTAASISTHVHSPDTNNQAWPAGSRNHTVQLTALNSAFHGNITCMLCAHTRQPQQLFIPSAYTCCQQSMCVLVAISRTIPAWPSLGGENTHTIFP